MTAKEFNERWQLGATAAGKRLEPLRRKYEAVLRANAKRVAAAYLRANEEEAVTAAADPDEIVDAETLAIAITARTAAERRRMARAVGTPLVGATEPGFYAPVLATLATTQAQNATKAVRDALAKVIEDGLAEGWSVPVTAVKIEETLTDYAPWEAERLARTDLVGISNGTSLRAAETLGDAAPKFKRWITAGDADVRETHREAGGQTVEVGKTFTVGGFPMDHPGDWLAPASEVMNCFPAETLVNFPGLRCVMRRWYEGDLVKIRLASGDELSATPNHPILRADGVWVAIGAIEEGDDLVCARLSRDPVGAPYEESPPLQIGEVYDLLRGSSDPQRVGLRPPDFHGDGVEGYVDVVAVDGVLGRDGYIASDQEIEELGFALADLSRLGEGCVNGSLVPTIGADVRSSFTSATGGVGGGGQGASLRVCKPGHAEEVRFASVADREIEIVETTGDYVAADAEGSGDREHTFPTFVSLANVVEVKRYPFVGHVYNLDSGKGWYTANSVPARNCRCTQIYLETENASLAHSVEGGIVEDPIALAADQAQEAVAAAAVDFSEGTMVALYPERPERFDAEQSDLHVTLCFLPEGVDGNRETLVSLLSGIVNAREALSGTIGGMGFFAEGDDGMPVIALPDVVGLNELRTEVAAAVAGSETTYATNHGFLPHITLTYVEDVSSEETPNLIGLPLDFRAVTLVEGTTKTVFPFALPIETEPEDGLLASSAPLAPPDDWFADPELEAPTPLTVTPEGRVFGHLGEWGKCHTGIGGRCVMIPRSSSGYADFHNGGLVVASGEEIRVGKITLDTGHAPLAAGASRAAAHYDHTGHVGAFVRAGEDEHGPWLAGAVRSDATPEQIRDLRANPPSGDWRKLAGRAGLELIAALAVPVQGFPVAALSASGDVTAFVSGWNDSGELALVASAEPEDDEREWRLLEARLDGVEGLAALVDTT